ncbi:MULTISPECIES: molybdopterin-dependent oxidoreductase [Microvirga]|uniref:molybdopterin-dependent oxidoreductase n=1 Tax=Microvirga TaxID=186650 RepID=UPI001CFFC7F2|nr:molybdopterin-dependent oxidoreductase [Microvirga lenta]MCB5177481.1 molybdopterin-dependent oxidoreductase [Microvirga lenta]
MHRLGLFAAVAALLGWGFLAHAAESLPVPSGPVLLTVSGAIERTNAPGEARFDRAMLDAMEEASLSTLTVWADEVQHYEGVPLRAVLDRVGYKGTHLRATASDAYEVTIPLSDLQYEPLIALRANGRDLTLRDKGPLWIVYPRDDHKVLQDQRYDSRWIWHLSRLQVE